MKDNKLLPIILLLVLVLSSCSHKKVFEINLSGTWQFKIDSMDVGIVEKWYSQNFEETVQLPGSMVENGKGNDITLHTKWTGGINPEWVKDPNYAPYHDPNNIRFPFWLQPLKKYTGASWYQKIVTIPEDWKEKNIWLNLERPHWETQVWVNGKYAGMQNSLGTAHVYDISQLVITGKNNISICVDNRTKDIDVGENSHSISDHTQSNWNGIVGDISLQSADKIYFKDIQVFPNITSNTVEIKVVVDNTSSEETDVTIKVEIQLKKSGEESSEKYFNFSIPVGESVINIDYPMVNKALTWDEFNPNVYTLSAKMEYEGGEDKKSVDFGFRDFKAGNSEIIINGRPIFLRGTLECAIFPKTGYPPTDTGGWRKVYTAVKAHGLNHVRFHSWCPPEAAFEVADEMGVYLQVECSSWATIGDGKPIDQWLYDESNRMVAEYGNHPSFVMMAYGNEPHGDNHAKYLSEFVQYWKNKDNRRVYTSGAGWPALPENDYHNLPQPRIQRWAEELKSIINSEPPKTDYDWSSRIEQYNCPVVSHEIGQWCVYPNFKEIKKYDGVLKATNFEIFQQSLEAHGMLQLADSFLMASGKLQALCYKADIEAALRTSGLGGFQLLDLHDFPGQGTALVGVLDPFWEEKGYISPEEYRRFCNETVPLARFAKRVFNSDETIKVDIEVAHFGEKELSAVTPKWKIIDRSGNILQKGALASTGIKWGNGIKLGSIETIIPVKKAKQLTLEVEVAGFSNSWNMWIYPSVQIKLKEEILIVQELNAKAVATLNKGGKVLLTAKKGSVKVGKGGEVGIGFSSIFWNTAWTGGQKPHTLGILCDPKHPALAEFPTEYHSNWQWWDAMSHSNAINVETFSKPVQPIVRVIDDWVTNRQLALVFEVKVGKGKLVVSGVDLVDNLANRPEAQQLLYSLKSYMTGNKFTPATQLSADEIIDLFK